MSSEEKKMLLYKSVHVDRPGLGSGKVQCVQPLTLNSDWPIDL
jgi:hypothetical protein